MEPPSEFKLPEEGQHWLRYSQATPDILEPVLKRNWAGLTQISVGSVKAQVSMKEVEEHPQEYTSALLNNRVKNDVRIFWLDNLNTKTIEVKLKLFAKKEAASSIRP